MVDRAKGCDYSRWQDDNSTPQTVNFEVAHKAGLSFVFIKASQATWTEWEFWQWGLGKGLGPTYGAESQYVDMDWYKDTAEELWEDYHLPGPVPTPKPLGALQFMVAVPKPNVRSGPGTRFPIVDSLPQNAVVTAQDVGGGDAWVKVSNGWVGVELAGTRYLKKVGG